MSLDSRSRIVQQKDPYFLPAEVHLLPTGHFALETHVVEIADFIRAFLAPVLGAE